jgi:hypothetical protein
VLALVADVVGHNAGLTTNVYMHGHQNLIVVLLYVLYIPA